MKSRRESRKGFTLLEAIVSLFILGIFVQIVYAVFIGGINTSRVGTALENGQQTVRIVTEVLNRELVNAKNISATTPTVYPYYAVYTAPRGTNNGLYIYTNKYNKAGEDPETVAIAGYVTSLTFYRDENTNKGILKIEIKSDEERDRIKSTIEIPLENLNKYDTVITPTDVLYYTKYE